MKEVRGERTYGRSSETTQVLATNLSGFHVCFKSAFCFRDLSSSDQRADALEEESYLRSRMVYRQAVEEESKHNCNAYLKSSNQIPSRINILQLLLSNLTKFMSS
jgi:hypothetical protein